MQAIGPEMFSKEKTKSRLLKKAAQLWGYQESEADMFDPLITLLMESCAVEFEKIAHEIQATQYRVLERLAHVMSPGIDIARPAYGILQVRPVEPYAQVHPSMHFVYKRTKAILNTHSAEAAGLDIFFSPINRCTMVDGAVRYIATQSVLWEIENGNQKVPLFGAQQRVLPWQQAVWIGLELASEIDSLEGISFLFDWQNEPNRDIFYQYLPYCRWSVENQPVEVEVKVGLPEERAHGAYYLLNQEFDVAGKAIAQLLQRVEPWFVTIQKCGPLQKTATGRPKYPAAFQEIFSWQELARLPEGLTWVKVEFPETLPPDALSTIFCAINCFPVVNRRLHKLTYRLQQQSTIVPLESKETFFTVKEVCTASGEVYKALPLISPEELTTETYTIRYGVNRFDTRNAGDMLYYLLELLRDESAAFSAIGEDFLSGGLRELRQIQARLEQKIHQNTPAKAPTPYLVIKPKSPGDNVYIEFWTTNGEEGNRIPAGSRLQAYTGADWQKNETYMIVTTSGGKQKPTSLEKLNIYRQSLLTRTRVVTQEDIRVTCLAELGSKVKEVKVKKSFMPDIRPAVGFIRCIQVTLVAARQEEHTPQEWAGICETLRRNLESLSAANLPFQVSFSHM